jgi:hypothetical protein
MTIALLASCILFMAGQSAISTHQLMLYWTIKLAAIFMALLASVTLTTVWEEWVIWRLSSRPANIGFFGSVLRTNLYVLVLVMAVPALLILPKRLKSPDFLAKRANTAVPKTRRRRSSAGRRERQEPSLEIAFKTEREDIASRSPVIVSGVEGSLFAVGLPTTGKKKQIPPFAPLQIGMTRGVDCRERAYIGGP